MTTITLESIQTEQKKLADMIAAFEAQAKSAAHFPVTLTMPELNDGERYIGAIISADGSKHHHLILLPGEATEKNWEDAKTWAESIGGELPDRSESALLFATMRDEFKSEWYWTREQHASLSGYAWMQYFDDGRQSYYHKGYEGRARAVRRLKIL